MIKVLGIDPGTRSFDLCGLENGKVVFEEVVDTLEVAKNPGSLIKAVEKALPVDLITGPSGYGVELTYLRDLDIDELENWYLTYILLLKREHLEEALKQGNIGIMVYSAMTKTALEMKRRNWPVCYIPGVIHLPTVPEHRKINKMDIGTADKMCIAVLGVYDQSREYSLEYSQVSFILIEMGFGYNAVIGVENGRVVDGIGGTTGGPGFLTAGAMDLELVQLVEQWEKADVFSGGGSTVSGKMSPEEIVKHLGEDKCMVAWEAMIESVIKGVSSIMVSVPKPREILISGRLTRVKGVEEELRSRLSDFAPIRRIGWVEGARKVKEAAQGYAIVADGLAGGQFKQLIEWMKIKEAKGTALDHIHHPKGVEASKKLRAAFKFK